ncbi:MAG: hypothetical protein OH338_05470 [Candidatus Parvarchaeota archaeon]|nr:hypothetical protein [Candidatus Parvarchaeum tengchongense]MCW1295965.1 hypothetical protein [Candidatus Parvarchaeum tengchongense]MCW1298831.1 hypothetical protein [Candidatus Parvarchaeum tengchongense]MCW1312845.1 hypothetical protein [Candidatus Parvarchaeum tengchongense]
MESTYEEKVTEINVNKELYEFGWSEFDRFWRFLEQKQKEKESIPELEKEVNIYAVLGDSFQRFQEACLSLGFNLLMATCIMCRGSIDSIIINICDYLERHRNNKSSWSEYENWSIIKNAATKWKLLESKELGDIDNNIRKYGHMVAHQSVFNENYTKGLEEWLAIMQNEKRRKEEFYKVPEYLFTVPDNAKLVLQKTNDYLQKVITNLIDSRYGQALKD